MLLYALLGLLLAPALNLAIQRLPRRQPLLAGGPRCGSCDAPTGPRDALPVLGWLLRRGRCRRCGTPERLRVVAVEIVFPIACALLWWRDGRSWALPVHTATVAFFLAVFCIDLEHRLVLNRMTGPGLVAALVTAAFGIGPTLPQAALGALVGFVFLLVPFILLPGLGMGDVKLAAVIGAFVGFPGVLTALVAGVTCGGIAAAALLATRRVGRRDTMAYAPYLVIGVLLVVFGVIGGAQ